MTLTLIFISLVVVLGGGALFSWWRSREEGEEVFAGDVLAIRVPRENEKDALAAEQMFASLHGLLKITPEVQEHLAFEIVASASGICFYVWVPSHLREFVRNQIFAQYPAAEITVIADYAQEVSDLGNSLSGSRITLSREQFFPIKTFPDFKVDPLAAITGALTEVGEGEEVWVQILTRPLPDVWQEEGYDYIDALRSGLSGGKLSLTGLLKAAFSETVSVFADIPRLFLHPENVKEFKDPGRVELSSAQQAEIQAIEEKVTRMGFESAVRVLTLARTPDKAAGLRRSISASFKQFSTANLNSFVEEDVENVDQFLENYRVRSFPSDWAYVLNTEELASVFHLPHVSVETPTVAWSLYKKGEPPLNLPTVGEDITYFARTTFRDQLS